MKTTCPYCSMSFDAQDAACPYCGAPNENAAQALRERGQLVPRTIEELRSFCESRQMLLEQMRFFIGRDYRGPRAFGIYRDQTGDFVVYKNKSDGTRSVRYKGRDEAHAVNELYLKLREEVERRKTGFRGGASPYGPAAEPNRSYTGPRSTRCQAPPQKKKRKLGCFTIALIIFAVILALGAIVSALDPSPSRGYYRYDDNTYYYQNGSWYIFDQAASAWRYASIDDTLREDYKDYYSSYSWDDDYAVEDFHDSGYYELPGSSSSYSDSSYDSDSSWDDDWDSDSDWDYDYDSWDSGDTDWDSDW